MISDIFPPKTGGSGRWFWEIYGRLPRDEFLVAAGEDPRQEAFDATHDLRVTRVPLAMRSRSASNLASLWSYGRAVWRLRSIAKNADVTMLHCARPLSEGLMGYLMKMAFRLPYASFIHGEDINIATTSRELTFLTRHVLGAADYLIANSLNTRQLLLDEWALPEHRVHLLYPGVDTNRFHPAAPDPAVRSRFGWQGRIVVLTVGRLQKRKGHDRMIQAVDRLRQTFPNILYAIIGEGGEETNLRELTERNGLQQHVQFLGEIDDDSLVNCYQQCDLFILPNRQEGKDIEGFGMVLLEAQACAKPVVAGDSGGTAETMRVPETGWVVDCREPEPLVQLLEKLLSQPNELAATGNRGRVWVCEHFDWSVLSHRARELFEGKARPYLHRLAVPIGVA